MLPVGKIHAVRPVSVALIGRSTTAVVVAALAVGVAVGEQGRNPADRPLDPLGVMLLLAGSVPVALAGRWPVAMYLVALVGIDLYQALAYTVTSPYFLGVLLTAYAAAAPGRWRRSAALALLSVPLFVVGGLARGRLELGFPVPILACAAFAAGQIASELRAASERQAQQARREADLRLVAEERLRIARELHDVVSHTIATIGIQAGVAAHVLDREPEEAREALAAIKTSARDAMHDLRGMMGVLRQDAGTEPAPGLSSLPELLERVRAAGVAVELDVRGTSRALTPATDLAAYRVVQEALTNVIRHAPGASARISVDYAPGQLQIEVTDSGGTAVAVPAAAEAGTGHGLIGLRERAAALGGTLEARPLASGGFRIRTCLPTDSSA